MKSPIEIDTRTFVRFWLVVIGLGLLVSLFYAARDALFIIGISMFLALALNAPVSLISRRLPGKSRVGATAIAYVLVVLILGGIVLLVVPPIVQQTAKLAQSVPTIVDGATNSWEGFNAVIDKYNLQSQVDSALNSVKDNASGWASNVGVSVVDGIGSIFSFIVAMFLVLVLTFLMLIEGPNWMKRVWGVYTNKDLMQTHRRVVSRIYGVVQGYVTGQITVALIGASFSGLAVFILSLVFDTVPASLALPTAAITFVLALIPMFGATIGGVIVTALLALNNIPAAVIYVVALIIYQQIENNMIVPHVQARKNELSALTVLVAVTIGIYMFGIIGGIIAIPIAGTLRILLDEYLKKRSQRLVATKS